MSPISSISHMCVLKTALAMVCTMWRRENVNVKDCSLDQTVRQVNSLLTGNDAFG